MASIPRSNEPEFLEAQLTWPIWLRLLFGKPQWHFDKHPPSTLRLVCMRMAHEPHKIVIELVLTGFERAQHAAHAVLRALRRGGGHSQPKSVLAKAAEATHDNPQHSAEAAKPHGGHAVTEAAEHDGSSEHAAAAEGHHAAAAPDASSHGHGDSSEHAAAGAGHHAAAGAGSHRSASSAPSSSSGGASSVLREGQALTRSRRKTRSAALLFVYAAWGIMVWMIFVYGRLLYNLLGSKAEASFVSSWAIALGLENASGFQDVVAEAAKAALIALLLEPYLVPSSAWMEQASCLAHPRSRCRSLVDAPMCALWPSPLRRRSSWTSSACTRRWGTTRSAAARRGSWPLLSTTPLTSIHNSIEVAGQRTFDPIYLCIYLRTT